MRDPCQLVLLAAGQVPGVLHGHLSFSFLALFMVSTPMGRQLPVWQRGLRLLAFNAEAWLAEHFNAYLADLNEYRATLRNLLHQAATIDYTPEVITVTLDRPDSPRVARSLELLAEELSALEAHMPGDPRPLTCQIAWRWVSTITQ